MNLQTKIVKLVKSKFRKSHFPVFFHFYRILNWRPKKRKIASYEALFSDKNRLFIVLRGLFFLFAKSVQPEKKRPS